MQYNVRLNAGHNGKILYISTMLHSNSNLFQYAHNTFNRELWNYSQALTAIKNDY